MQELVITVIGGLGQGAVIALVAMSLNVLYNASGILNFAQGDFLVLGGVLAFVTVESHSPTIVIIGIVIAAAVLVGITMGVQGVLTLARLRSSVEQHTWLVTTLAASAILESCILLVEGPAQLVVPNKLGSFTIAGVTQPWLYPILLGVAIAIFGGLQAFYRRTTAGLAMNALRQDLEAARAAGANVRMLQLAGFVISGIIVGLAGALAAPVVSLSQASGIGYALNGFAAAVIGGLGNQFGALIAGPVLGIVTEVAIFHLGGEYQQIAPLVLLAVVLLWRPQGIFGQVAPRRV
ncbi:branched-chain amino acid ABC transporter permease [Leekyejoonella antrihumi]|uniref:Branched-chain amino acid ABC transporter permease n=1 Tax=Leekyejoonella antrihumi TaxID=1660198 RepID=A0A563DTJ3_9MICO|nr:branched-chain amino acid ABC transporter permease [Leekyejoonella antrihumi]TWP33251.1 branched-chain amino acid ABC transporter permease [Leekyejoonella antrihumi]